MVILYEVNVAVVPKLKMKYEHSRNGRCYCDNCRLDTASFVFLSVYDATQWLEIVYVLRCHYCSVPTTSPLPKSYRCI